MQAILRADFLRGNQDEKDQVKGSTENIPEKFQEQAGKSTGGKEQEARGSGRQATGKHSKEVGDAKEAVRGKLSGTR
jgi:uncharacterized protein YjbJ (UPF0337 family)